MIQVYFGTNRNPVDTVDPTPDDYGSELYGDGTWLRFGKASVADDLGSVEKVDTKPEQLHSEKERQKLGSAAVFREIARRMRGGTDTVLFIHGFNYSFEEALIDAARLKQLYKAGRRSRIFFVFTWPSDGTLYPVISYPRDRTSAEASGQALGRGILKLGEFVQHVSETLGKRIRSDVERDPDLALRRKNLCPGRLHLMAHSMGAYALRHAVQGMRREVGDDLPRLFDEILLFAPDEDADAFEHDHKLALLPRLARRVTVYHNREDIPLAISDLTKGNPDRLGSDGPAHPHRLPAKVSIVDCTDIVTGFQEHRYHKVDDLVIDDIQAVLRSENSNIITGRKYQNEAKSYSLFDAQQ